MSRLFLAPRARSCKPQMAAHVLLAPGMTEALEGKLLISILAGTTIAMMRDWVPKSCTVVRSMPNTPSKVGAPLSSGECLRLLSRRD